MFQPNSQPLQKEQLVNADGICPIHGRELVMAEYGNPDSGQVCPTCEAELVELNTELAKRQDELLDKEQELIDARFALALEVF